MGKRSIAVIFMLAAGFNALGQNNPTKSPAGEPPRAVRNGRATLVGHFSVPTQMRRLDFALVTPHPDQEEQFLKELMTPGSPQFHKFLTADQWIARFSPSVADEQAVVDWAASQGLTVTHRFPNRLIVDVEGPIATIEKALGVRINSYLMDGYTYFANEREPVLPPGVVGIIRAVEGLNNFPLMQPASFHGPVAPGPIYTPGPVVGQAQTYHADGNRAEYEKARAALHANLDLTPHITSGAYDPTDIYAANAYDYGALQNLGHCCNPNNVSGGAPPQASIAIAAYGNLQYTGSFSPHANFTDILGFQAQYSYLAFNITATTIDGGPGFCTVTSTQPCSADLETTLDTEWTTATANSFGSYLDTAQIFLYEGEGGYPGNVVNQILSDGNARVFTTSFGCGIPGGEDNCPSGVVSSLHSMFNSMAGQGWTMMSASGDQGATADCATTSVSYPASDPDIVAVGGTTLQSSGATGIFASEVAWTGGTGANSCTKNAGGSTGGCSTLFPVPGYQTGSNGSCGTQRSVPDIALNANVKQNMYYNGKLFGIGGTSIASPMLAGFFAQEGAYLTYLDTVTGNNCGSEHEDCEQIGAPNGGMGIGNYYLYNFGLNPSTPSSPPHYPFYDITSGCNTNDITAANPSLTFYCAGPGYDLVTGWGTANMLQLAWAINTYLAGDFSPPAVNFTYPGITGQWYNTPQTVNWTVADTSGNGAVPNGVAGFSQAWDSDPGDVYLGNRASTNNSYFSGPEFPNATAGNLTLNSSNEGCHTANVRTWDNGGTSGDSTFGDICYDDIPPVVNCGSPDGLWHGANVSIACTASDSLSGLLHAADASFNLVTSVPANTETSTAFTNSRTVSDVATNTTSVGPLGPNMVDRKPPSVSCGTSDGLWHATDVSIPCTASDGGSGLAVPADASFNLTTSVPMGTETNNAATNSLAVADKVGNSTTAGPINGNMVDKKPPTITITQPTATNYTHSSTLTLNYTVTDGGSGVGTVTPTMNGSGTVGGSAIVNGLAINLLTALPLGPNTFAITAYDKVLNMSSASVTFTIIVTAASIIADVNELQASGAITMNTNPLLAKLNNALADRSGGNCTAAGNVYGAFINQVMAQTGKGITAAAAAILIADAQYLEAHCP